MIAWMPYTCPKHSGCRPNFAFNLPPKNVLQEQGLEPKVAQCFLGRSGSLLGRSGSFLGRLCFPWVSSGSLLGRSWVASGRPSKQTTAQSYKNVYCYVIVVWETGAATPLEVIRPTSHFRHWLFRITSATGSLHGY